MDYQEGVPLSKLVRSPASFAETELKFILVSILNALQKVHEYKIVHGGIQPTTIILGKDGEPLLTDFAAARLAIAAHSDMLAGELASGYAPPELYERIDKSGSASDFYALGATMYYCITHNQPTAAQSRIMALGKGEPDPMAPLSGSPDTTYSAELLQAIDWMLQPEYQHRSQSAAEILAILKSGPINDQTGPITSKQEPIDIINSRPMDKNLVWIGVMVGIVGLVIVGIWFGKKTSEISGDNASTATSESKEASSVALPITQASQGSDSDKIAEHTPKEINKSEKQPKLADEAMRLSTSADDNQPQNGMLAESTPFPANKSVSKPELKDKITTQQESDRNQQLAVIDKSRQQPKKQNLPEKPTDKESIESYLAAAKKAMKAVRLTTPSKDNASKYYRMVLAIEPDNAEARAGLQKIVDRYVWFLQKARAEGKLNTAKRALQKAESVLPDDPKLHRIRAELAAAKE
jgi:serine/threonine protein kinase